MYVSGLPRQGLDINSVGYLWQDYKTVYRCLTSNQAEFEPSGYVEIYKNISLYMCRAVIHIPQKVSDLIAGAEMHNTQKLQSEFELNRLVQPCGKCVTALTCFTSLTCFPLQSNLC